MISFRNMGRLANFLYQAFAAYSYSRKYNLGFSVPTTDRGEWHPVYLRHLINPLYDNRLPFITIDERQHSYHELPFNEEWRKFNIILHGYFQSYKYFQNYIDEIRTMTGYAFAPVDGKLGIHVRRGDYLLYPEKHIICPVSYYDMGINIVAHQMNFSGIKMFSDDIQWCKENFDINGFEFSEGKTAEEDLQEMMNCQAIICANSSFSVLAATLNSHPARIVVAPHEDVYFHPKENLDVSTMYPPDFHKIKF